jgi:phytoene synthase
MDLIVSRYPTLHDLELYCYRVASVVGLLSIEIFGYQHPACRDYAVALGHALQLTNILRDVAVDADRGRIYLPLDALEAHQVAPDEILRHQFSPRYAALAADLARHARARYTEARAALPAADRANMVAAELMGSVYWRLLRKLERRRFDVFGPKPLRLNRLHKAALILLAGFRHLIRSDKPAYGLPA